jgi:hypothetical protein
MDIFKNWINIKNIDLTKIIPNESIEDNNLIEKNKFKIIKVAQYIKKLIKKDDIYDFQNVEIDNSYLKNTIDEILIEMLKKVKCIT